METREYIVNVGIGDEIKRVTVYGIRTVGDVLIKAYDDVDIAVKVADSIIGSNVGGVKVDTYIVDETGENQVINFVTVTAAQIKNG